MIQILFKKEKSNQVCEAVESERIPSSSD